MLELEQLFITLAEPSAVQAQIITKALNDLGISHIETHVTGAELISQARERRPDLVVSAYYLPDMTGDQLVQELRDSHDLYDLPFILVSSETMPERLEPIRQAGSLAILPKPFSPQELDHAMQGVMNFINCVSLGAEVDVDMAVLQVLIVDDSVTSRHHIRQTLEKLGFENFFEADSAAAALPLLENESFSLIVLDHNMPGMTGVELAREIRDRNLQPQTPVLMVTSEEGDALDAATAEDGIAAICPKPFEIGDMRELIRRLLREY
nr:response regulator [Chromobacterium sp. ASV5]